MKKLEIFIDVKIAAPADKKITKLGFRDPRIKNSIVNFIFKKIEMEVSVAVDVRVRAIIYDEMIDWDIRMRRVQLKVHIEHKDMYLPLGEEYYLDMYVGRKTITPVAVRMESVTVALYSEISRVYLDWTDDDEDP